MIKSSISTDVAPLHATPFRSLLSSARLVGMFVYGIGWMLLTLTSVQTNVKKNQGGAQQSRNLACV